MPVYEGLMGEGSRVRQSIRQIRNVGLLFSIVMPLARAIEIQVCAARTRKVVGAGELSAVVS